jgi:hypothetical protein
MDGGNLALHNNFFFSREQKDSTPYLEVDLGEKLSTIPPAPKAAARPAPESAHLANGAAEIEITPTPDTFCYRITLNHQRLPPWLIPHPRNTGILPVKILLEDLAPDRQHTVDIVAVSTSGQASAPTHLQFTSSATLPPPPKLDKTTPPVGARPRAIHVFPPLVKTSPDDLRPLNDDLDPTANSLFDGQTLRLTGARNEHVAFQVATPNQPIATITLAEFKNATPQPAVDWYPLHPARNKDGQRQPAYLIPSLRNDRQSHAYVEIYIPKNLPADKYTSTLTVDNNTIPLELTVHDFTLPDTLSFWPELNVYRIPEGHLDYFRLAHDNRCVANFWKFAPRVRGQGASIKVDWSDYDHQTAPLLSGQAFKDSRRGPIPVECMYLPYADNWPTNLTQQTYRYEGHWPGRGEDKKFLVEHSLTAPPIEEALSPDYKAAFASVQKQFLDHFQQNNWTRTEMQLYFGGKQSHRINFGSNMWWTTDEPSFLHDWLALQFFHKLWTQGLTPHLPIPSSPHLFSVSGSY